MVVVVVMVMVVLVVVVVVVMVVVMVMKVDCVLPVLSSSGLNLLKCCHRFFASAPKTASPSYLFLCW
jgi:hypothetical protein